jgi:heat shock protein HslJ
MCLFRSSPADLLKQEVFMKRFVLCIIMLFFYGIVMAADRYINIITPDGTSMIDPAAAVVVSGTGRGLFEGNVVIRFEDLDGKLLVQQPTTMRQQDIDAAGKWQTSISLPRPVPESVRLLAFSPSPKDGEAAVTSTPVVLKTSPSLEATSWRLSEYLAESGELQPVIPDSVINARFAAGKVSGSAGCNRYFGAYTLGGNNRLLFDDRMGSTQMACAQSLADQERRYLALLAAVNSREIRDGMLLLRDKQGQLVLQYRAEAPLTLENTSWQATGINNGRGGVVSSAATARVIAMFANGKVSGSSGCNNYSAKYEINDSQITIGRITTTRWQCTEPEGVMVQEREFLQALAAATQYILTAGRLELRDGKGSLQVTFTSPAALR